jgi:energy-coupling factor transporter transmembrane protein EcfT
VSGAEAVVRGVFPPRASSPAAVTHQAFAPVLAGAMAGSLIAARLETALLCVTAAGLCAVWIRAGWPRARWTVMLLSSMTIAFVINLYLVRGQALPFPHVFGAIPSREGARLGALLALRLLGASIAFHALAKLWPGERAADELLRPLRPLSRFGVPIEDSREVLGLAVRFMPLLIQEARRIARVQTLRAGRPPRGLAERMTRTRATLIPTLVAAIERAEQLALTLEARHHRAKAWPTKRTAWGATLVGLGLFLTALLWRN